MTPFAVTLSATEAVQYIAAHGDARFVVASPAEAANARLKIYRLAYRGIVNPVRVGGRVRFLRSDIDSALARGQL